MGVNIYHCVLPIRNSFTTRGRYNTYSVATHTHTHIQRAPKGFCPKPKWCEPWQKSFHYESCSSFNIPKNYMFFSHQVVRECFGETNKISTGIIVTALRAAEATSDNWTAAAGNLCKQILRRLLWRREICGNKSQCRIPACSQVIYLSTAFPPTCLQLHNQPVIYLSEDQSHWIISLVSKAFDLMSHFYLPFIEFYKRLIEAEMQKVADIADISVLFFQGSANFWTRLGWEQEHYRNK